MTAAPTVGQPVGTAGPWFSEQGGLVEPIEGEIPEGTTAPDSDGVALGTPFPLPTVDTEFPVDPGLPPAPLPTVDACALITAEEWTSWAGDGAPSPQELEEGNACGWTNAGDTLRLAVGVTDLEERTDGEWHPEIGLNGARWFEAWPVAQSSSLITTDSFDVDGRFGMWSVIVEVSGRGDVDQARLLETAAHFAPIVLGRLP